MHKRDNAMVSVQCHMHLVALAIKVRIKLTFISLQIEGMCSQRHSLITCAIIVAVLAWIFRLYPWQWHVRRDTDPPPVSYGKLASLLFTGLNVNSENMESRMPKSRKHAAFHNMQFWVSPVVQSSSPVQ